MSQEDIANAEMGLERALEEWKNAGGNVYRVSQAIDMMICARLASQSQRDSKP